MLTCAAINAVLFIYSLAKCCSDVSEVAQSLVDGGCAFTHRILRAAVDSDVNKRLLFGVFIFKKGPPKIQIEPPGILNVS